MRLIRIELGLTQEQVADRAHIDFTGIGKIERGGANPTFETILRLTTALEISFEDLAAEIQYLLDNGIPRY